MQLMPDFLVHYACLCAAICVAYLVGHVVTAVFLTTHGVQCKAHFVKLTVGVTVPIVLYAAYVTAGKTILLSLCLIGVYAWCVHAHAVRKQRVIHNLTSIEVVPLFLTVAVSFVVFYLQYYELGDSVTGTLYALHPDHTFYGRVAQYLNLHQIENSGLDWIYFQGQTPNPYHYMEIWMAAMVSKLCSMNTVYAAQLIVFPLLFSVIYIGAVSLLATADGSSWKDYLTGLLIFVTASFTIVFPKTLMVALGGDVYQHTFMSLPKLSFIYIYLLWAILAFQVSAYNVGATVLTALGIIYPLILPSVYAATLLTVWYVYRRGHLTRSSARSVTMLMGSVVLYFIIFYGMARTSHSYAFVGSTHAAAEYYGSMRSLITAVNIIGSTAIKICVSNLPYLMIMCIAAVQMNIDWSKMYRHPIAVLTVLLFVLSLLMWSALHFMFDSVQFWYLVYFPLIGIGAYYLLGTMLYRITCSRLLRVCAVLVLMLNIGVHPVFARESDLNGKFYMQIAHMVSQSPTATYAYIKSESDYNSAFEKSPTFIVPLHMLAAYTDVYLPVSLSVHDTPLDTSVYARHREISMIQSSPFYRFVAQQQADNIFVSLSHSQVAFIKQFHIQYLILSSSAQTSPMLEALFDEVIEDAGYGYQFIKLSI